MTIQEKTKYITSLGYIIISDTLGNNLEVECPNKHIFKRAFKTFINGSNKCPVCQTNMRNDNMSNLVNDFGLELLSIDNNSLMKLRCSTGHIFERTHGNFKNGSTTCPVCEQEAKRKQIINIGYEVVSDNLAHELVLRCVNGHYFKRKYDNLINGSTKCPECEREMKRLYLTKLGYQIMSDNLSDGLILLCPHNHTIYRSWSHITQGHIYCPECIKNTRIRFITSLGYKIESDNIGNELEVQCAKGHKFKRVYKSFKQGVIFCPMCDDEEKIEWLNSLGFEVLSENLADGLEVKCSEGHIFKRTHGNFKQGITKCPVCHPNISSQELEIQEFLSSLGVEYQHSDWNIIKPQELDFYIPSHNLAIEFDGIYWHSELQGKNSKYHLAKTEICLEKGISLLHIFENEWTDLTKREIWKSIIKGKLGMHKKIGARKCVLREVSKAEAYEFLDANHLQGRLGCTVALGLYHNDELVNLMTFGKNRMGTETEYELLRFASKKNVSIQGGASKLFKHFTQNYPGGVVSYSDRRYSQGNMYSKLGFALKHNSKPNYFYFKNTQVLESRQKYMKHKLHEKLETFDPNLTEWENMKLNKFDRIWDCGNGVWVYNDNN